VSNIQKEFDKYKRDMALEIQKQHPTWQLMWWDHYDSDLGRCKYGIYGNWSTGSLKDGDCVSMGVTSETGIVLDVITDPNEECL